MKIIIIITIKCFWKIVHMNNINTLYYGRIGVSEGADANKKSTSRECIICHYLYFLYKEFNFQPAACNGFHDLLMMSLNFIDIAILNIHYVDYRCIINEISKSHTVNVLQISDLSDKSGSL